jgi:hypothetical protein
MPFCPLQNPYGLPWVRTQASELRSLSYGTAMCEHRFTHRNVCLDSCKLKGFQYICTIQSASHYHHDEIVVAGGGAAVVVAVIIVVIIVIIVVGGGGGGVVLMCSIFLGKLCQNILCYYKKNVLNEIV